MTTTESTAADLPPAVSLSGGPVVDIRQLLPQSWAVTRGEGAALVTGYCLVANGQLAGVHTFDLLDSRLFAFCGAIHCMKNQERELLEWAAGHLKVRSAGTTAASAPGNHLVCVTPLRDHADPAVAERDARERSFAALGAAMLQLGENVAYSQVSEHVLGSDGRNRFVLGQFRAPFLAPINEAEQVTSQLHHMSAVAASVPPASRERLGTALRWLGVGMGREGTDAYLSMWIALEILVMRGATDVRPINEALATHYGITYREACSRFFVGKLFGIRSRIVHYGAVVDVNANVRFLMRALFYDCLHHEVGGKSTAVADVLANAQVEQQLGELLARVEASRGVHAAACPCGNPALFAQCHGRASENLGSNEGAG
jgi:hypothetical protein